MAPLPPNIQTYHCICTSLLLASTHMLSSLPRRSPSTSPTSKPISQKISNTELILPLPTNIPDLSQEGDMPSEGYSILLGMDQDRKTTIVRREDGFEKRVCWRCARCRVVVGYELDSPAQGYGEMDGGGEKGKGKEGNRGAKGENGYEGKVIYLLPNGIMSTEVMMGKGKRIAEGDLGVRRGGLGVFE